MKWYKYMLIILVFIGIVGISRIVYADSGWDSSYDSGGSWDSSSSWDSGSSWSDSSSGGGIYISGGGLDSVGPGITVFVIIIITIIILSNLSHKTSTGTSTFSRKQYIGLTNEQIKEKDATLDKVQLEEDVFQIYREVQTAWMNFDYDVLRENLTDELYNMYESQLKTLKIKNQKNIMKEIVLDNIQILSIDAVGELEEVKVYLCVSQYDYVEDKNHKVLRGTDKYKNIVEYVITFVRSKESNGVDKCPNCGAPVEIVSGGVCPYCDSTIVNQTNEFVMSKKECVGQWRK